MPYVDTVSGSNANPGTEGSPWLTVAYATTQLVAGDTLYIRGGASYAARRTISENIAITSAAHANGSSGSPIVIRPYAGEFIEWSCANGSAGIRINGRTYWELRGADADTMATTTPAFTINCNNNSSTGYGVFIEVAANNCAMRRVTVTNGNYVTLVRVDRSNNFTMDACRLYDNAALAGTDHHGLYISTVSGTTISGFTITDTAIWDCAGDCVQIQNTSAAGQISGVSFDGCLLYTTLGGASENAIDDKDSDGLVVTNCEMYGFRRCDGTLGGTSADGQAIIIQNDAANARIYNNLIYDCSGAAFRIDRPGCWVYRNIVRDMTYEAAISEDWFVYIASSAATSVIIANNTFVGGYSGTNGGLIRTLASSTFTFQNNICYQTRSINNAGTATAGYNDWYSASATISGTGDITGDPLFIDLAGDDYTLSASSPCINAGTTIAGITDGYSGTAPDMGYVEYAAAASPSVSRSVSPSASISPSISASSSPSRSVSQSRSLSPSSSASRSASPSASISPSTSASPSPSASASSAAPVVVIVAMGGTPPALRAIRLARGVRRLS